MPTTNIKITKQYKKYPSYKDSCILWLGEVPEGWGAERLKFVTKKIGKSKLPASYGEKDGEYVFFTSSQKDRKSDNYLFDGEYEVVGDGGFANFKYINGKFSYSDHCFLLKASSRIKTRILHYTFLAFINVINDLGFVGMGLKNLNNSFFFNFNILLPPTQEQEKIAEFLDEKTDIINKMLEKKKKFIKLLEEKRKALINDAVTKGLDKDVKMKEEKIKFITSLINKKLSNFEKEMQYIALENIKSWKGELINVNQDINPESIVNTFNQGDVLFGKLRPYLAKVFLANFNGICSGELLVLRSKKTLPKFLFYKLLSKDLLDYINNSTFGTKMPRANWEFIGNIKINYPNDIKQQEKIVKYLDQETEKIDKIISKIKKSINLLTEYKSSLITNVVTGKVKI